MKLSLAKSGKKSEISPKKFTINLLISLEISIFAAQNQNKKIMEQLIGREREVKELWRCFNSPRSEFVVVYGRRRIGKTFLVTQTFKDKFSFLFTGSHKAPKERQLELFAKALQHYGRTPMPLKIDNWYHAFDALELLLESLETSEKKILFFDEMPWIDTSRSEFVSALEDFWNTWAALRDDIYLIASGSATSWMVKNLVENQGGLHNRITSSINLQAFTLRECEQYLRYHNCTWDRYTIAQSYMYLGGVPFYYSLLEFNRELSYNVDLLFFRPKAKLSNEFNDLYNVLFTGADKYIEIVRMLAQNREGMTRKELGEKLGENGGGLTRRLQNLENCDFIMTYSQLGNKKKGAIIRLTDFFTLFYYKFIDGAGMSRSAGNYWSHKMFEPSAIAWQGLTFELICLKHVEQIKKSLSISGVHTEVSSWRSQQVNSENKKAQIDLVIDRGDRCIHLCEMKFSTEPYAITKEYEAKLRERMAIFREETKTRKTLLTTFVTTFGIKPGVHAGIVQQQVTLDELFDN